MAGTTARRRHPDERTQRQHRCERPARVVANSPATRPATPDPPMGVPPPPLLWGRAYCRWQCRGRRGLHLPLVRRLRMGSLLPGSCGAESRGWLLVHHYRSLRIRPNLSLANTRRGDDARTRGSSGRWSPGHTERRNASGNNPGAVEKENDAEEEKMKGTVSGGSRRPPGAEREVR